MTRYHQILTALTLLTLGVALMPGLDLAVSRWFFDPQQGFWMATTPPLEALRQALWDAGLLIFLLCLAGLALSVALGAKRRVPVGFWARSVLLLLLGPGLVVSAGLKSHWGRARPRDITEFNGDLLFSPALRLSDQCASNCAFSSGEGALAFAVALVLGSVVWSSTRGRTRTRLMLAIVSYALLAAGLRIGFGGHFLSDTLFSGLICLALWQGLGRVRGLGDLPPLSPHALRADLRDAARALRPLFQGAKTAQRPLSPQAQHANRRRFLGLGPSPLTGLK